MVVGFEDTGYTVTESEGRVIVCIVILSPNDLLLTGSLSVTVNISAEISNNGMARSKFTKYFLCKFEENLHNVILLTKLYYQ